MKAAPLLAIPLATTFAGAAATATAQTVTYDLTVNPVLPITQSYLFFVSGSPIAAVNLGSFEANVSVDLAPIPSGLPFASDEAAAVFLGVYEDTDGTSGLSVSLTDRGTNNPVGPTDFDALFGDFGTFEAAAGREDPVVTQLLNPSAILQDVPFGSFVNTPVGAFLRGFTFPGGLFGERPAIPNIGFGVENSFDAGISNFSTLTDGGTLVAEVTIDGTTLPFPVIPEPASLALLGAGGMLLLARRRR